MSLLFRHIHRYMPIALIALLSAPSAAQQGWGLEQLMTALAERGASAETREMEYVETKYLAAVDVPLVSRGTLRSLPDDSLEMEVTSPQWSKYIITETRFTMLRKDKPPREIELADEPRLAAFAAVFRATREGDLALLEQYYSTELVGGRNAWQLQLRPIENGLAGPISYIYLKGSGGLIEQIDTVQTDGDRSEMRLEPAGE